jgi:telomerase reverse transcriptase
VSACFDSIPQDKLLELADALLGTKEYATSKHASVAPPVVTARLSRPSLLRHRIKYQTTGHSTKHVARVQNDAETFLDKTKKRNSVYVGTLGQQTRTRHELLDLLGEHVERNIVKIGKRFYRQKRGIPQGSVASSLLCSLFYAQLESEELGFIAESEGSVLLRLIDDFLVISTEKSIAKRFLDVMLAGLPEYGVVVKTEKSLVNFDATTGDGARIQKVNGRLFPYVGVLIDTGNLNILKDIAKLDTKSTYSLCSTSRY